MLPKLTRSVAATGLFLALAAASSDAAAKKPAIGSGGVLAPIAASEASLNPGQPATNRGFPEGVAIADGRVYVAGPATFGTAGKGPSLVTVLHRGSGAQLAEIPIVGENTAAEHALSGIAVDGDENVYVLSTQLGVVRIERHCNKYTQESYAPPLPDLPVCTDGGASPCSPTPVDLPPLPNEMTFDDDGNLYISDSMQATIFRVPAGGGAPEVWFQSPLLAGSLAAPMPFGANGIKVSPDRDHLYVVETFDPADPTQGHLYRVPLVDDPQPEEMELVHTFQGFAVPDSLVFGRSGRIYVSLAGTNQIAVLDDDGEQIGLLQGPAGSDIPFDAPATMVFDDAKKSLLVANHAIFGDPAHFAVLRVYVGERGDDLPAPEVD